MTREEAYTSCIGELSKCNCLLMELPTGFGKSKLSIDLVNYLCSTTLKDRKVRLLLLVAKRVHKQTWKEEIEKWGGVRCEEIIMECYESLKKHQGEHFDIILADEVHHIKSEVRLEQLDTLKYGYMLGLSATIPRNLKLYFKYHYHARVVSCKLTEAIENEILPEPEIVLMPLELDNRNVTETWEINPKAKGPVFHGEYKDLWKYKKEKLHAILSCTKKQKILEMNKLIEWERNRYMRTRNKALENIWLHHCGQRLEFLSNCKVDVVKQILRKIHRYRSITFCKTINQTEELGKNCIHSQNRDAEKVYDRFNQKKINHITAVNILNENANLVDCKYAVFANLSSSEVVQVQRLGRSLRHKKPVIIMPYYKDTREQEIVEKYTEGFDKNFIRTVHSVEEI